jgi:hypothetical protein
MLEAHVVALGQAYIAVTTNEDKSWDVPKAHTHLHVPADVRNKGATVNGNTKTFEVAHTPFHDNYQNKTNYKDVGKQVSLGFFAGTNTGLTDSQLTRMNDEAVAGSVMRDNLDRLDARIAAERDKEVSLELQEDEKAVIPAGEFEHVSLGSKQAPTVISALVNAAPAVYAPAFRNLHTKIAHRLTLMKFNGDHPVKLKPDVDEVSPPLNALTAQ